MTFKNCLAKICSKFEIEYKHQVLNYIIFGILLIMIPNNFTFAASIRHLLVLHGTVYYKYILTNLVLTVE